MQRNRYWEIAEKPMLDFLNVLFVTSVFSLNNFWLLSHFFTFTVFMSMSLLVNVTELSSTVSFNNFWPPFHFFTVRVFMGAPAMTRSTATSASVPQAILAATASTIGTPVIRTPASMRRHVTTSTPLITASAHMASLGRAVRWVLHCFSVLDKVFNLYRHTLFTP